MDRSWKIWVYLAFFLALALVIQSIRLVIPLPGPVNMFFIGSLLNAVMALAAYETASNRATVIGAVLPLGAYLQGQLPIVVMIPVVACGNMAYILWVRRFGKSPLVWAGPIVKAALLYGGTLLAISLIALPQALAGVLSFMMSWPQIVTGTLGLILARLVRARLAHS